MVEQSIGIVTALNPYICQLDATIVALPERVERPSSFRQDADHDRDGRLTSCLSAPNEHRSSDASGGTGEILAAPAASPPIDMNAYRTRNAAYQKAGRIGPKELGLFWPMQTSDGMTVDVFIYASTLQKLDPDSVGPVGLLKRHRTFFESIASEKFDRDGVTGANLLHVTEEDLRVAQASEAKADDAH